MEALIMQNLSYVTNLRLKFPGGESLLFKDLSLSLSQGEKVLFLGPSGCGKSTLLQVLSGIIPHSIEVPIKYEEILLPDSWGFVFQDPDTQFCMPYVDEEMAFVLENLQVPRAQMKEKMMHYLDKVGLHFEDLHTSIQTLSQGMKQRLALASILALEPEILFLDEPTALLDPEGTEQVWETLKNVGKEKTVVIVEHKIEHIIDFVDRVVLFNKRGQIIANGAKDEIFTNYKKELIEYGIWYPGVWDEYANKRNTSHEFESSSKAPDSKSDNEYKVQEETKLAQDDKNSNSIPGAKGILDRQSSKSRIELRNFNGLRGKKVKIALEQANVQSGEWIGVVGENGAGKSTLLLAMMQLLKTAGTYKIDQKNIENVEQASEDIAYVFQNPEFQFVTNSVYEEIAHTLKVTGFSEEEIDKKVSHLLAFFELTERKEQHPYQLSMGQKRRLSVASAIVREQGILLLDEPTFGQDAKNTFSILEKIEEWRKQGTTIIMVTHDIDIVKHFTTRVWVIDQGEVIADLFPTDYLKRFNSTNSNADQFSTMEQSLSKEEIVCN
jgi:energy-coupling factor transporter ATP-binding protein EcfA2